MLLAIIRLAIFINCSVQVFKKEVRCVSMKNQFPYIITKVESKAKKAIYGYNLIEKGDGVLVGISGGKDSFALLDVLVSLRKSLPVKFRIEACHVVANDMPYKADEDFMKNYCQQNKVNLHFREIEVEYDESKRQPACFICSWKRRKELFKLARELKCEKVALGHHLDDAIETLMLNMIHHSSISSIPPMLSMFDGDIKIIRPLILVLNSELKKYSEFKGFPSEIEVCRYNDETHRESVRQLIYQTTKLNRAARENIFRSMGNILSDYIVPTLEKKKNLPDDEYREVV